MPNGMNIQYGSMNPFRELQSGIATGLQLGRMGRGREQQAKTSPGVVIPTPERKQVNPIQVMRPEIKDMAVVLDYNKEIKKLPTEEAKNEVLWTLADSGKIQTEFGRAMLVDEVDSNALISLMRKIRAKDPGVEADIQLMIQKAGGEDSSVGQAVTKIRDRMEAIQKTYDQEFAEYTKAVIGDIDEVQKNLYEGKIGNLNPQTLDIIMKKKYQYLQGISQIDPNWVKNYLKAEQNKRRGKGFRPTNWKGKLSSGKVVYGSGVRVEEFMRQYPGVQQIEPLEKMTEFERYQSNKTFKENPKGMRGKYDY